jgi:DNA-directed RNA polymerase subunit RPC12/RpoP
VITRDEGFVCAHCGRTVPPAGRTSRNHCPACLRSLHVDVVPGDRAETCGGLMDPVGAEVRSADVVLVHRCRRCGAERRVRSLRDAVDPDDWAAVVRVSAGEPA